MNNVTILVPLSNKDYLQRLFASLELLDCNPKTTSLVIYVDGNEKLFVEARNLFDESKFHQHITVHRKQTEKTSNYNILYRRKRISKILNEVKNYIYPADYIFIVEDDTLVPTNALHRLLRDYSMNPYAGYISGVELGRHGVLHIGAWTIDDLYEPTEISSINLSTGLQQVDATGTYCTLTRYHHFMHNDFKPLGSVLGHDVEWGLEMRRTGQQNFIDMDIHCRHLSGDETISVLNSKISRVTLYKNKDIWLQKISSFDS